jgi:hypothetical protein
VVTEDCSDDGRASDIFDILCFPGAFGAPPEWCVAGEKRFLTEMMPLCRDGLLDQFPSSDVQLSGQFLSDELELMQELANQCDHCEVIINVYNYDATNATMSTTEAVDAVLTHIDFGWTYSNFGAGTTSNLSILLGDHLLDSGEFLQEAASQVGSSSFELGLAARQSTPFANVDAFHDLYVLNYPDVARMVTIEFVDFFD